MFVVLHELHLVHTDLKPENILYRTKETDSDIVIADFGMYVHRSCYSYFHSPSVIVQSIFTPLKSNCIPSPEAWLTSHLKFS